MRLIYEYGDRREQRGREEGIEKGREEGIEKGREEGREEGIKEIILSFINSGTPLSEISQKTGKSIEELNEILKD